MAKKTPKETKTIKVRFRAEYEATLVVSANITNAGILRRLFEVDVPESLDVRIPGGESVEYVSDSFEPMLDDNNKVEIYYDSTVNIGQNP